MAETYTEEDLDRLEERVEELEQEYSLSVAARESIVVSWRNILTSSTIPYDSVTDEKLEEAARSASLREGTTGVYDVEVPEDGVFVDLTDEPEGSGSERERFSEWSDEKTERKLGEAREKLAEVYGYGEKLPEAAGNAAELDRLLEEQGGWQSSTRLG